jgi:uncharacterized protein
MTRRRRLWFLPETPDVLGTLHGQFEVTLDGMRCLARWADTAGAVDAADSVREAEHRADTCKLELRRALRASFSTPLDSEDIYEISERLEAVMNGAKDTVREAELMEVVPDAPVAAMANLIVDGVGHLEAAVGLMLDHPDRATTEADAATKCQRRMEKVYRAATAELMAGDRDLRPLLAHRELYRRMLAVGDHMASVSERVWYAVVKES